MYLNDLLDFIDKQNIKQDIDIPLIVTKNEFTPKTYTEDVTYVTNEYDIVDIKFENGKLYLHIRK